MKKFFLISASFLALSLVLTGCSQSSSRAVNPPSQNRFDKFSQPDFGQPDRMPDVRGVVKSMVGNEVTVLKIDLPAGGRASSTNAREENSNGGGVTATQTRNTVSLAGVAGGIGARDGRMMGGGPGEQTGETRAQMLAQLKAMSTGEETIIIPVGIQMLRIDTSNNQRTMVAATLADITTDKNITVWLSNNEANTNAEASSTDAGTAKKIAEFVLIN